MNELVMTSLHIFCIEIINLQMMLKDITLKDFRKMNQSEGGQIYICEYFCEYDIC